MLQIIWETLAVDCIAYADGLDHPDDYWFANRTQTETETTSPTKPRWSAITKDIDWSIGNNDAWYIRAGGVDALV